jgi:antitoxin CcdA
MGKIELKLDIDADLLRQAREAGVDMAKAVENGVRQALEHKPDGFAESPAVPVHTGEDRARHWAEENAEALDDYRKRIERRGPFGEEWRRW